MIASKRINLSSCFVLCNKEPQNLPSIQLMHINNSLEQNERKVNLRKNGLANFYVRDLASFFKIIIKKMYVVNIEISVDRI